jgi:hypothetical protein
MRGTKETMQRLAEIERQLDRVYTALVVRDPGTPLSADAYEGLRRQVVASTQARIAHVGQLAEFDVALHRGAGPDDLRQLVTQWLNQAGVVRIEDPALRDAFETNVAAGQGVVVEIPAYIDSATNRVVRQGRLREAVAEQSSAAAASVEADESASVALPPESAAP